MDKLFFRNVLKTEVINNGKYWIPEEKETNKDPCNSNLIGLIVQVLCGFFGRLQYTCDRTTNDISFVVEMDSDHRENHPEMDVDALWNYVCERFTAACDSYYDEVLGAEERSKMTYSEPEFLKLYTDPNGKMYVTGYIYARYSGDLKLGLSVCISHRYRLYLPDDL